MFRDATLCTVLPAKDVGRLKQFLSERLGLEPVNEQMGMYFYEVGGSTLFIYESTFAGTNQATAASFDVSDIDATVNDLRNKGVVFEHYEMPGMTIKNDVHIMEDSSVKSAWFKDTEGNIININQSK